MTNPTNPSLDYELISIRFKNEAYILGADSAVYLEGEEDEYFWRNALNYAKPDKKYEFYYSSNPTANTKEEERSGSSECAKLDRKSVV